MAFSCPGHNIRTTRCISKILRSLEGRLISLSRLAVHKTITLHFITFDLLPLLWRNYFPGSKTYFGSITWFDRLLLKDDYFCVYTTFSVSPQEARNYFTGSKTYLGGITCYDRLLLKDGYFFPQDVRQACWEGVCHQVLGDPLLVWDDLLRPLFLNRVKVSSLVHIRQ